MLQLQELVGLICMSIIWFISLVISFASICVRSKHGRSHIPGTWNYELLEHLNEMICEYSNDIKPDRVLLLGGPGMGGFGVYQLASYAPQTFDVVLSISGYCEGARCPLMENSTQEEINKAAATYDEFLQQCGKKLATVPVVAGVYYSDDPFHQDACGLFEYMQQQRVHNRTLNGAVALKTLSSQASEHIVQRTLLSSRPEDKNIFYDWLSKLLETASFRRDLPEA